MYCFVFLEVASTVQATGGILSIPAGLILDGTVRNYQVSYFNLELSVVHHQFFFLVTCCLFLFDTEFILFLHSLSNRSSVSSFSSFAVCLFAFAFWFLFSLLSVRAFFIHILLLLVELGLTHHDFIRKAIWGGQIFRNGWPGSIGLRGVSTENWTRRPRGTTIG